MKAYINTVVADILEHNPEKSTLVIAINKKLKYIDKAIAYDKTSKEPVLSLINSIYWNGTNTGKNYTSGKEIIENYNFIEVSIDNVDEVKNYIKNIHFYLNNLDLKISGGTATFYEDKLFKLSKEYTKEN